jgi:putative NIF3 family GTP cyclohydrolase 1 type 2
VRVQDILQFLDQVDPAHQPPDGVDRLIHGNADASVHGIAVMWMPYRSALERAHAAGCDLAVVHEPTFYDHHDRDPFWLERTPARNKRAYLDDRGISVVRCHDLLDRVPRWGVPDSWGAFLGLPPGAPAGPFLRVHDVAPTTALGFATSVADAVAVLGQQAVQLLGPPDAPVRRVMVGTGAITPVRDALVDLQVDLAVCTDDGIHYWRDGTLAIDAGLPLVVVNHAVSEEAAMRQLAAVLGGAFPDLPVHHLPQACMYRLVTPTRSPASAAPEGSPSPDRTTP